MDTPAQLVWKAGADLFDIAPELDLIEVAQRGPDNPFAKYVFMQGYQAARKRADRLQKDKSNG
jgi:hypothetical protein